MQFAQEVGHVDPGDPSHHRRRHHYSRVVKVRHHELQSRLAKRRLRFDDHVAPVVVHSLVPGLLGATGMLRALVDDNHQVALLVHERAALVDKVTVRKQFLKAEKRQRKKNIY